MFTRSMALNYMMKFETDLFPKQKFQPWGNSNIYVKALKRDILTGKCVITAELMAYLNTNHPTIVPVIVKAVCLKLAGVHYG